jgi:ribosomal protein S5
MSDQNAIDIAVLQEQVMKLTEQSAAQTKDVAEIKMLIAEIKGGYKFTSTLIMVVGGLLGFVIPVLFKRLFNI